MDVSARISNLREVVKLISSASETLIAEWTSVSPEADGAVSMDGIRLPSPAAHKAQRTLLAAVGSIEELACEPQERLISFTTQFYESRALHVAAQHRIADVLGGCDGDGDGSGPGMHVSDLAAKIGVGSANKLARIMRLLCSQHVFREASPDRFANNSVSRALVGNEPLSAYLYMFGTMMYTVSDYIPYMLTDPKFGPSHEVGQATFQMAIDDKSETMWEWMQKKIPKSRVPLARPMGRGSSLGRLPLPGALTGVDTPPVDDDDAAAAGGGGADDNDDDDDDYGGHDGELVTNPELPAFQLAMVAGGRVFGTAHLFDYPWKDLGEATVVDVGGGVGGFDLQLAKVYPRLRFVVQDRPENIEQARQIWQKQDPEALRSGRVRLTAHDFFDHNPVKGAEVYWLRYIVHSYSDDLCVKILSNMRSAMGPGSRLLIAEQVMNHTVGAPELEPAPKPLLANYGHQVRYRHELDVALMSLHNGIERTPAQFRRIIERAGLRLVKIWECRSHVSIIECRLA